jgi:coenzyme F420-reducing hydrogenase delta subunit
MPQLPVDKMRSQTNEAIAALQGEEKILVYGCEHGLNVNRLDREDTKGIRLLCSGMLPPTLVEYALKNGADGVMVTGCRHNDCFYRFGNRWTKLRFEGKRKPILRGRADRDRIRVHGGAETDKKEIENDLNDFRAELVKLKQLEGTADSGVSEDAGGGNG